MNFLTRIVIAVRTLGVLAGAVISVMAIVLLIMMMLSDKRDSKS